MWSFNQNGKNKRIRNKKSKGIPQGSCLSPALYNLFDTLILNKFEKELANRKVEASIHGYADDHVFVTWSIEDANTCLAVFKECCAYYGMVLETSKTELVSEFIDDQLNTLHEDTGKPVSISSKTRVRWLGFNLFVEGNRLCLDLGVLVRPRAYLELLSERIDENSLTEVFRVYIQSTLNFYYCIAKILGYEQEFTKHEMKLRTACGKAVSSLPYTKVIAQAQLEKLLA